MNKLKGSIADAHRHLNLAADLSAVQKVESRTKELFDQYKLFMTELKSNRPSLQRRKIERLRCLKAEILNLQEQSFEKRKLIANRVKLYRAETLPEVPLFESKSEGDIFKKVLGSCMRVNAEKIQVDDIFRLRSYLSALKPESEEAKSVQHLVKTIEVSLEKRKSLFTELVNDLDKFHLLSLHFEEWPKQAKILFLARGEQILNNPFEPPICIDAIVNALKDSPFALLLQRLESEDTRTKKRKDFWDNQNELERKVQKLAQTPQEKLWLKDAKFAGVIAYRKLQPVSPEPHLIVGAGPGGLIRAIGLTMRGRHPQLIEKRAESKTPRMNTVTLGKWEPKELQMLLFLGVISQLDGKNSFSHNRPYYIEVALGHLEKALEETWNRISKQPNRIIYNTSIADINNDNEGNASIRLENSQSGEASAVKFAGVHIVDGASGKTKEMLGISRIHLAKPTLLAFSIFKKPVKEEVKKVSAFKYRVLNGLKGVWIIFKTALLIAFTGKSAEAAFSKVISEGPSGLSRVPSHDYLLRIFRKSRQREFQTLRDRIALQKTRIAQGKVDSDAELVNLESQLKNKLHGCVQKKHAVLDFLHQCLNPSGHRMRKSPMEHEKSFLVDVMVSKAEQSQIKMGKTCFFIRGDACHTTDPFSGTGCKTAIEEMLADQYFLTHQDISKTGLLDLSILQWGQNHYQQRMIDKAFEERFSYYHDTELFVRYADLAKQNGFFTEDEFRRYVSFAEKPVSLSKEDVEWIQALNKRCMDQLGNLQDMPFKKRTHIKVILTMRDSKRVRKRIAKMTCSGDSAGWVLALVKRNQQLLKRV